MSSEHLKYKRYGDSAQAKFIVGQVLICNRPHNYDLARETCLSNSAKFGETFQSIIGLFQLISLVEIDASNNIALDCNNYNITQYIGNDHQFCSEIIKRLFKQIHNLKQLDKLFPSSAIIFDIPTSH